LKHLQQYKTNIGRMAKVTVLELDKKTVLKGKLTSVDENHFTLDVDGILHTIAFDKNYETKIIPSF
jgi:ribosome maturation factor RimP